MKEENGAREEFTALVQRYQGLVYTICHQLVPDPEEAQDLAQETFLAAWRAADRCPAGYERQWLARIAANKARDHLRSAWARRMTTPGDEILGLNSAPPEHDPEEQTLCNLGEQRLREMVLALREPYLTPCRLCLLEQYAPAEAAALCGRPEKTLRSQLTRAKRMLRAQLEQEERVHPSKQNTTEQRPPADLSAARRRKERGLVSNGTVSYGRMPK